MLFITYKFFLLHQDRIASLPDILYPHLAQTNHDFIEGTLIQFNESLYANNVLLVTTISGMTPCLGLIKPYSLQLWRNTLYSFWNEIYNYKIHY